MKRLVRKANVTLCHGTSDIFLDNIKQNGLVPNDQTGHDPTHDASQLFAEVGEWDEGYPGDKDIAECLGIDSDDVDDYLEEHDIPRDSFKDTNGGCL